MIEINGHEFPGGLRSLGAQAVNLRNRNIPTDYNHFCSEDRSGRSDRVLLVDRYTASEFFGYEVDDESAYVFIHEYKDGDGDEGTGRYAVPVIRSGDPDADMEQMILMRFIYEGLIPLEGTVDELPIVNAYQKLHNKIMLSALRNGLYIEPIDYLNHFQVGQPGFLPLPRTVRAITPIKQEEVPIFLEDVVSDDLLENVFGDQTVQVRNMLQYFVDTGISEMPAELFSVIFDLNSSRDIEAEADDLTLRLCLNQFNIDIRYASETNTINIVVRDYPRRDRKPKSVPPVMVGLLSPRNNGEESTNDEHQDLNFKYVARAAALERAMERQGILRAIDTVAGRDTYIQNHGHIGDTEVMVFRDEVGNTGELFTEKLAREAGEEEALYNKQLLRYRRNIVLFRNDGKNSFIEVTNAQLPFLLLFLEKESEYLSIEEIEAVIPGAKKPYIFNALFVLSRIYREYGYETTVSSDCISDKNRKKLLGYRIPLPDFITPLKNEPVVHPVDIEGLINALDADLDGIDDEDEDIFELEEDDEAYS